MLNNNDKLAGDKVKIIIAQDRLVDLLLHAATREDIAEVKGNIADLRFELKADIAELKADNTSLRAEFKADNTNLRAELKADIAELKVDNTSLRTEFKADITDLRAELKVDIAELKTDIKSSRRWVISTVVTTAVVCTGAVLGIYIKIMAILPAHSI